MHRPKKQVGKFYDLDFDMAIGWARDALAEAKEKKLKVGIRRIQNKIV